MLNGIFSTLKSCPWVAKPIDGSGSGTALAFHSSSAGKENSLSPEEENELSTVLEQIFERYDLDSSGTCNSHEVRLPDPAAVPGVQASSELLTA